MKKNKNNEKNKFIIFFSLIKSYINIYTYIHVHNTNV